MRGIRREVWRETLINKNGRFVCSSDRQTPAPAMDGTMPLKRNIITSQSSRTVKTKIDSSCIPTTVMDDLDDNLLSEILIRLPGKTVAGLIVINKRWCSLISNPSFVNAHTSLQTNQDVYSYFSNSPSPASILRVSSDRFSLNLFPNITISLGLPKEFWNSRASICASCHGLLLIKLENCICIFNPLTKKKRLIPFLPYTKLPCCYGLVFGPTSSSPYYYNHYNVVCLVVGYKMVKFKIFDSKKGRWRDSDKSTMIPYSNGSNYRLAGKISSPVCFRGIIHWLNGNGDIIAFNLHKEESRLIEIPKSVSEVVISTAHKFLGIFTWLGFLEDEINLVVITPKHEIVVWVLYDYENNKWKIKRKEVIKTKTDSMINFRPMFFDGERLVLHVKMNGKEDGFWNSTMQEYDIGTGASGPLRSNSPRTIYPNISTLTMV